MAQAKYAMPTKEERAELELAELRREIAKQEAEITTAEQLLADIEENIQAGLLIPSKIENFLIRIRTQIFLVALPKNEVKVIIQVENGQNARKLIETRFFVLANTVFIFYIFLQVRDSNPDPFRIQGFDQQLKKKVSLKFLQYHFFDPKIAIFLSLGLHTG